MPEHQRVQKIAQKIQNIQDKRRDLQKESTATKEEMRKIREEIDRKEERFRLLSDKVDKNRMTDAEMEAEVQRDCRQEKKEEVAMHHKQAIAA